MRAFSRTSKTIYSFLNVSGQLSIHKSPWLVSGKLYSRSGHVGLLTHGHCHYQSSSWLVALRKPQLASPNLGNMVTANYGCNVHPAENSLTRSHIWRGCRILCNPGSLFNSSVADYHGRPFGVGQVDARRFSTSDQDISRFPSLSQKIGDINYAKRYVGKSTRHQDNDVNNNSINVNSTRYKLHDRTRSALKGRFSRLKTSLSQHKARLRDKIRTQRIQGAIAVGTLHKKFGVKKEDVRTIPNLLTVLRMASAPVLAYLVVNESFGLACSIFVIAGVTDLLDGYIARNFKNQTTALGTALDPLADKLLISFLTVSLTSVGLIPVPLTVLILSRDAGLIVAAFYIRYMSLAPPRTLSRYFDVSHVTARLHPSKISKVNTLLQLSFVASTLASPVFDFVGHPLLQTLMYLTATTTLLSGADYMLTWKQRLQIIKNK